MYSIYTCRTVRCPSKKVWAVDQQYRQGKFKRLGMSNQSPSQVEELVEIAEK
jgi:aryl-alcohol dehydrogenase-like predicted oxidoreductase